MTRLGFAGTTNGVELARLEYRFPITDNIRGYLSGAGMSAENISNALSPQVSGGFGAISRFGRYNPVFRLSGGAGVGFKREVRRFWFRFGISGWKCQ